MEQAKLEAIEAVEKWRKAHVELTKVMEKFYVSSDASNHVFTEEDSRIVVAERVAAEEMQVAMRKLM